MILIIDGKKQHRLTLSSIPVTIGRAPDNVIVVDDDFCSQIHLELRLENGKVYFKDLGSKNGTYLNHFKYEQGILDQGDLLEIGRVRISLAEN